MNTLPIVFLPDVILRYLEEFLNDQDRLALALSGAFNRFAIIHGEQRYKHFNLIFTY